MTVEKAAPKYTKLRTLLAVSFALLGIASAGLATFATYQNARAQLRQDIREHLRDAVSLASLQVNGDNHATLTNPSQEGNYTYMQIKRELQRIRDTVRNAGTYIRFVYTMRQQPDGSIIFVVDAEESPEDISHLGDVYSDAGPVLTNNFSTMDHPIVEDDFYTDQWGTWLTGYAPFYTSNGKREGILGMDIPANNVIARERNALWTSVALFGLMIPVMSLLGWLIGSSIAKPLTTLTESIEQFTAGNLTHRVEVRTRTEVKKLANTFNTMAEQLSSQVTQLEQRVAERTDLLKATNEIGQAASSILNSDELISKVVNLITDRFGHYYAALFLIDPNGKWAELKEATGEEGRLLKESGHRLEVGGESMVGTAISTHKGRIALDVGKEPIRFSNPLLPYTRSEIALPLIVGEHALGALDVQSTKEAAFSEQDIETFQGMANQVAIALENARLFLDAQQSLEEIRSTHQQSLMKGWAETARAEVGLEYAIGDGKDETGEKTALDIPLSLREQIIGKISLEGDEEWTPEDRGWIEAVATQAALALENARLLAESQQLAINERVVAEITSKVWSSATLDGILQTAIKELGRTLNASEATIELKEE